MTDNEMILKDLPPAPGLFCRKCGRALERGKIKVTEKVYSIETGEISWYVKQTLKCKKSHFAIPLYYKSHQREWLVHFKPDFV